MATADLKRYKSPAMRAREERGRMTAVSAQEGEAPRGTPDKPQPNSPENPPEENTSIFVKATAFGGMPPKEGQSYSMMVKSVDPETGDAECEISDEPKAAAEEPAETREQAFDERMPEDDEGSMT